MIESKGAYFSSMGQNYNSYLPIFVLDQETQTDDVIILQPVPGKTVADTAQQLLMLLEGSTEEPNNSSQGLYLHEITGNEHLHCAQQISDESMGNGYVMPSAPSETLSNHNYCPYHPSVHTHSDQSVKEEETLVWLIDCLSCWFKLWECYFC